MYRDFELQKAKLENVENYTIKFMHCSPVLQHGYSGHEDYRRLFESKDEPYYFRMYLQRGSARKRFLAEYKTPIVKKKY